MLLTLSIVFLLFPKATFASEDFSIEADVTFEVTEDHNAHITHDIRLENLTTEKFTPNFTFSLNGMNAARIKVYDDAGQIPYEKRVESGKEVIVLTFNDSLVGQNKHRNFVIEFDETSLIKKTGEVWEISLPKLSENTIFDIYDVRFIVPKSLGELAYISPQADSVYQTDTENLYYFQKDDILPAGVTVAFGHYQTFSLDLTYHLENPLIVPSSIDVALPPDSPYQQVYFNSITPEPETLVRTEEGNWIATYRLAGRERIDARLIGYVKVYSGPRYKEAISNDMLQQNLASSNVWQVDDPIIKSLALELQTPEAIYNYVIDTLQYNFDSAATTPKRLGAIEALNNPNAAICTEFTDLFIALARAAGIPAREVNGYAATENPKLQPLSLVADVLHSWPEYYDQENHVWIPIDPTWGDTTGGIDYFNKFDLKHIAFVYHGISPDEPSPPGSYKLGSNPQKDVYVNLTKTSEETAQNISAEMKYIQGSLFSKPTIDIVIHNPGPAALYNKSITLMFDNTQYKTFTIQSLLPFSEEHITVELPYGIFGSELPKNATVHISGLEKTVTLDKTPRLVRDLLLILISILAVSGVTFWYFKKR